MRWPGSFRARPPQRALRGYYGWTIEQGYQQMKEELGLDHHEGRSWRGFHHHACLVMLAYGFLTLEQRRLRQEQAAAKAKTKTPAHRGKKGIHRRPSPCRRSAGHSRSSSRRCAATTATTAAARPRAHPNT